MTTRKYEQRLRAESADATRARILEALRERLRENPSSPPSVEEIARLARVARSTVYVVFGSRVGLFDALAADLLERGGFDQVRRAVRDPDARVHMCDGIRGGVNTFAAERDLFRVLNSMAQLDPAAVSGVMERAEARRAEGMAYLAGRLAEQDALRPGVTPGEAADLLWVLTSFDAFDLLYTGRGLSAEHVADRLVATAERCLLRS